MSLPISSPVSRENSSKRSFSVAESSSKTEQPDDNYGSGSFALFISSLKLSLRDKRGSGSFALDVSTLQLESLMERRQVEGNNRDVVPAIAENARSAIPEEEGGKKEWNSLTRPILELDPWNMRKVKMSAGACDVFKGTVRNPMKILRMQKRLDAMKLRNYCPDSVPVAVEKDARSDVPDIDMKKYLVHGDTPLGEFVYFIRVSINYKRPLFVTFKNTKPPLDALMSAIDKENQDKDGFLHMTYRGEKENILENSPGVCLDLAESSFTQECHLSLLLLSL